MHKQLLALLSLLLLFCNTYGQRAQRFYDKVFPENSITKDSNLVYGSNYVYNILEGEVGLTEEDVFIDIYYPPLTDTLRERPLIIWAHGGSFLGGTKEDADIVYFCKEFAERGFVTASISYRLGYEAPVDSIAAVRTVYRALQDGRAAVRYMRSKAADYNIDTNRIYFGGTSAGAFIATNMVYLNLPEEVPTYVDTSERLAVNEDPRFGLDGIEGTTNDLSNSSEIHGVINFCGATKELDWIDDSYSRNVPFISMHGTEDGTVPYGTRVINLNDLTPLPPEPGLPIIEVKGSYDMDRYSDEQGYTHKFYTWYGADHVPYINFQNSDTAALYMDTLMQFTVKHVYEDFLGLGEVDGIDENEPPCDFNNGVVVPCSQTSITEKSALTWPTLASPNPAQARITIQVPEQTDALVTIMDVSGKSVFRKTLRTTETFDVADWKRGLYFVQAQSSNGESHVQKLILE